MCGLYTDEWYADATQLALGFAKFLRYQLPGTWSLVHGVGYEGRATSDTGYLLSLATKGIRICHITRVGAQSVCQVLGYRAG